MWSGPSSLRRKGWAEPALQSCARGSGNFSGSAPEFLRPVGRTDFARDFSPWETSNLSPLFLLFRPSGPKQEEKRKVQGAWVQGLKSLAKLVGPPGQGPSLPERIVRPACGPSSALPCFPRRQG